VISHTTAQFRKMFSELPAEVQSQARRAYRIFRQNPNQPSLRFKPVHPTRQFIQRESAQAIEQWESWKATKIVWYWIGSHADYDKLLSQSRRRP
jgi:inorganic triphosphatase YgiF